MTTTHSTTVTPTVLNDPQRRSLLRRGLASALRAGGHQGIAAAEVPTTQRSASQWVAVSLALSVLWAVGATVGDQFGAVWWTWPGLSLAVLAPLALVQRALGETASGLIAVAAWPITLWLERHDYWLVSHVGPVAVILMLALITRNISVRSARDAAIAVAAIPRSAPLIVPLVLVVLFLPSLSADVWQASAALSTERLLGLALLTIGILLWLVGWQLRRELPQVLASRAERLVTRADRGQLTRRVLGDRLAEQPFNLVNRSAGSLLDDAWPTDGAQYAAFIAASEGTKLTRPLYGRLALCVGFVAITVGVYLYLLLALVIDDRVASQWTHTRVPLHHVRALGLHVVFPGGPYVTVTAMLGCLAVATFLAFAVLEDRFATALGDALLRLPADQLLVLALPYLKLHEERVANGDPIALDFDIGAETNDRSSAQAAAIPIL